VEKLETPVHPAVIGFCCWRSCRYDVALCTGTRNSWPEI